MTSRDAKLVQYLNEAYGKEKELETALEAHIGMTERPTYKKRLRDHLQETKGHARDLERRIKQLGGNPETISVPGPEVVTEAAEVVQDVARRGVALAKGPMHAVRGTSEPEKELKNAKTEYWNEAEEIANYTAIESLANGVGDKQTASLARGIRRQEQRMASFLERLIPQLTRAVVQAEIPAAERNGGRRRSSSRTTSRSSRTRRTSSSSARGRRSAGGRSTSSSRRTRTTGRRTGSARTTRSRSTSARTTRGRGTARTTRGRSTARTTRGRSTARTTPGRSTARTTRGRSTARTTRGRSTARTTRGRARTSATGRGRTARTSRARTTSRATGTRRSTSRARSTGRARSSRGRSRTAA